MNDKLKSVFERLIQIYEDAIRELPEDDWDEYLIKRYLAFGICWSSEKILGDKIHYEMWRIREGFWYKMPIEYSRSSEAIECLQWRVDKMKELLNEWE